MGQQCSCLQPRRKLARRGSDASSTALSPTEDDDDQEIDILIDGDGERDGLLSRVMVTKRNSNSAQCRADLSSSAGHLPVDLSALAIADRAQLVLDKLKRNNISTASAEHLEVAEHQRQNLTFLSSYQKATGLVFEGQRELECVMCLDTFDEANPKVRTLCNCGMNRTNFHLSCLLEWLNRDPNCPVCRQYLFYEEE